MGDGLLNERYEEALPPVNEEKHFQVMVDDKYHRSFIEYNGIDKVSYRFGGKGLSGDFTDVVLSEKEKEEVLSRYNQLIKYAKEEGIESYSEFANLTIKDGADFRISLGDDRDAFIMVQDIETIIMEKHPELIAKYELAVEAINQKEQKAEEAKQAELDGLSINSLKEKYPSMFDANGEVKKESISLIMTLIDTYAPNLAKQAAPKPEVQGK